MAVGWVVRVETSLVRELCRAYRCVKERCIEPSPLMLKSVGFVVASSGCGRPRRSGLSVWWRRVWSVLVIIG